MFKAKPEPSPVTGPGSLETVPAPLELRPQRQGISLFWRTFWFMFFLLFTCLALWAFAMHRLDIAPSAPRPWHQLVLLMSSATLVSFLGAAFGARHINRPLRDLSFAASRLREGNFSASRLNEDAPTPEIREVNVGFNRMADQLARIEQDRATMLAGISHDLRTPLARLRLETEISVKDQQARDHMASDIEQLDRTIDKFLDYARPDHAPNAIVCLNDVVDAAIHAFSPHDDMRISNDLTEDRFVMADEVDLSRVLSNLVENARRYGKTPETGIALVDITARVRDDSITLRVRDHGMGVSADALSLLTKPFYRGDAARTAAAGAGLGLSIVDKVVQRMGGTFKLTNAPGGGLVAHVRLLRATR